MNVICLGLDGIGDTFYFSIVGFQAQTLKNKDQQSLLNLFVFFNKHDMYCEESRTLADTNGDAGMKYYKSEIFYFYFPHIMPHFTQGVIYKQNTVNQNPNIVT